MTFSAPPALGSPPTKQVKQTLRFITCGSVDDGKSTLIGRLLYESRAIFDDQLEGLKSASRQYGTQGNKLDFALLVDGLQAEREQGITIDVAYRFFSTAQRRFIVADTPGHQQYTRNMATGASTADLAIVLVDARKGVLEQTRRHSRIAALLGIRRVILAVNKMDLIDFSEAGFNEITANYLRFAAELKFAEIISIPLCAADGDNIVQISPRTAWYRGPSLMAYLDTVEPRLPEKVYAFRMPVQWVNRPSPDFRAFCGRIAEGQVRPGDVIQVLPSGVRTRISSVIAGQKSVDVAGYGDAVALMFEDEVDVSRGDVVVAADAPPQVADQFEATLLWMHEHAMVPGRPYLLKLGTKEVSATITEIKHRVDVNTGALLAAKTLDLNELATVNLSTSSPLVFETYRDSRVLGSFILIDKLTKETLAGGMIDFALRRASNIHWQTLELNKTRRALQKDQTPKCIWFTGLSGSGKSTLANLLEKRLHAEGKHTYLLDGDNVRHGLNRDLGFTEADRVENIRRVAEVAKLMLDAGLIVLVSFISPFKSERRMARELMADGEFVEVFVDAPMEVCEKRDVKGLYAKARAGNLKNFTGIDSPYEAPEAPELRLATAELSVDACVEQVIRILS